MCRHDPRRACSTLLLGKEMGYPHINRLFLYLRTLSNSWYNSLIRRSSLIISESRILRNCSKCLLRYGSKGSFPIRYGNTYRQKRSKSRDMKSGTVCHASKAVSISSIKNSAETVSVSYCRPKYKGCSRPYLCNRFHQHCSTRAGSDSELPLLYNLSYSENIVS